MVLKEETVTGRRRLEKKERVRRAKKEKPEKNTSKTHLQKMGFTASQSWRAVNVHDTS